MQSRSSSSPTPSTCGSGRWCGSRPTPGCDRASWWRCGSGAWTYCAGRCGWPRRRRKSPAGWSGAASRPMRRAPCGCRGSCATSWAPLADRPHGRDDLGFTAPRGAPLRESKFVPGYFKPAARAAGLPPTLRFYDLRHTAASLLIREGASVKAVQKQLGHATASITLDTYGHLFPDELDALAGRLEDVRARALESLRAADVWPQGGPAI